MTTPMHDAWRRRALPDIRQTEMAECGLACLAMVSTFHGRPTALAALRRDHPVSLKGCSLRTLLDIAGKIGLIGRALRLEPERLKDLRAPAILHWDMSHFVVLKQANSRRITVHDPALGSRRYGLAEAARHFTGVALELTPGGDYQPERHKRLSVFDLLGSFAGTLPALGQVLILSLILQLYVLASPFYLQLAVDNAIAQGDRDLLTTLAVGFGIAVLINAGAAGLRTRILCYLQGALAVQIGGRLVRHLLRLPLMYFERRHVGDVTSRFYAMDPIRTLLTEGVLAVAVDGLMAVMTLTMIFVYSANLAFVVIAALTAYIVLRLAVYPFHRRRALDLVFAKARENTTLLETVRALQGIKLFGRETERGAVWMNRYVEVVRADTSINGMKQAFRIVNDLIFGIENIAVVYLGARLALNSEMTVGMLFAFILYKQQFVEKTTRLVEKALEFRMLEVNLERISDIVTSTPEPLHVLRDTLPPPVAGRIELKDVSFRYSEAEPVIFDKVSFIVKPGEHVALTGPSGGGKTTLIKIMLGLLPPTAGEVRIDGLPLATLGTANWRESIGVVMQDDQLLAGSIADNICFFDERIDHDQMQRCTTLAGIHDDIMRMPMAYDTLIGDLGSTLSGGQKQRILLARALYKRPRVLFLDEATSHLDVALERRVTAAVQALGMTRIIVAHRPETIASADRRLQLRPDGVVEVRHSGERAAA
jgi:ATP-binding cassette, subfamily B, bacterial CvaB/MchF/RaxB